MPNGRQIVFLTGWDQMTVPEMDGMGGKNTERGGKQDGNGKGTAKPSLIYKFP